MLRKVLRNAAGEAVNVIVLDTDTVVIERAQWDAMEPEQQCSGKYYLIENGWSLTEPQTGVVSDEQGGQ